MRKNRRKIDEFLLALENFMNKYIEELTQTDLVILVLPIKQAKPDSNNPIWNIELPLLSQYANKQQSNKYFWNFRKRRTGSYVRRCAYSLEYESAYWLDYEDIFKIILMDKWSTTFSFDWIKIKDFWLNNWIEWMYIIPKDYEFQNLDLYYSWEYEIIF